jgi:hypothetical protein
MPRYSKPATVRLVAALSDRKIGFEADVLDALEARADPDAMIPFDPGPPALATQLPALAVTALIMNQALARGLLQMGAQPAKAHAALIELALIADGAGHEDWHRRLMAGLSELGDILDHRISDLQTFGRSISPLAEPFRPSRKSLHALVRAKDSTLP